MEIEQPTVPTKVSRRKFLKGVAGVATTALSASAFSACEQIPIPIETNPTQISAQELKNVYYETDFVVDGLRKEIIQKIIGSPYEKDKDALLAPLDFYDANKNNHSFTFGYLGSESNQNTGAAYDLFHQIILLPRIFLRSTNQLDIAAAIRLYHELEHARQDSEVRKKYANNPDFLKQYLDLFNPEICNKTKVVNNIANFEQDAYMREIEILDLRSRGKFREEIKKAKTDPDFPEKQIDLYLKNGGYSFIVDDNDRKQYGRSLDFVFRAAGEASGSTLDNLSDPYKKFIVDQYKKQYKMFTIQVQDNQPSLKEI